MRQVVFLTGQSDPRTCGLSPVQTAFLDALPVPDEAKVRLNFPYDEALRSWRPTPLAVASARHVGLFVRSRTRGFRERHRPGVLARLDAADRTLVLAGSIGLDLLGRMRLPTELLDRLDVFAYGAFSTDPPACRTFRVSSRHDRVARHWPADAYVDGGHLDYLANPEVLTLCRTFLASLP